jgi:hypothetical protein
MRLLLGSRNGGCTVNNPRFRSLFWPFQNLFAKDLPTFHGVPLVEAVFLLSESKIAILTSLFTQNIRAHMAVYLLCQIRRHKYNTYSKQALLFNNIYYC